MSMVVALVMGMAAQAVPAAIDVSREDLVAGRDTAAIAGIMANEELDREDPARLINLGIAHARRGNEELARQMFEAAHDADESLYLETAGGSWIEARQLAARAMAMLDRGDFDRQAPLVASR